MIRFPFLISSEIHLPYDSPCVLYHIHVSPQSFQMSSRHFGVMLSGAILPADPWDLTWSSPVCTIYYIVVHSGVCYTFSCRLYIGSHIVTITAVIEVFLTHPVVSFTFSNPVYGSSSAVCWMCKVIFHLPRCWIKVPFCGVMVLIASFRSALYWPPSLLNLHSKDILCWCVVDFRYSVFSHITSPVVMHANYHTLAHIQNLLMQLSSYLFLSI